jgi:hypothetical protein
MAYPGDIIAKDPEIWAELLCFVEHESPFNDVRLLGRR